MDKNLTDMRRKRSLISYVLYMIVQCHKSSNLHNDILKYFRWATTFDGDVARPRLGMKIRKTLSKQM